MELSDCLRAHAARHPSMEPQDAVKLCYQAAFGPEHLLRDMGAARDDLAEELAGVPADPGRPLCEWVSPAFCRVDLSAWKARDLPGDWLFGLFRAAASGGYAAGPGLNEIGRAHV